MHSLFPQTGFSFNIHALPPLITAVAIVVLGLIVVIRERGSRVSLYYLLYTLTASAWMFCAGVALSLVTEDTAFRWMKFANAGVTMIPAALYHFTVVVLELEQKYRRIVRLAWMLSALFLGVSLFSDVFFGGFYHYSWGIYLRYRWPSGLFMSYFFVMTVVTLRMYWTEYRKSDRDTTKHNRAKAFLTAFSIGYLGALDFLPTLGIPFYPISSVPMICMLILTARAIWQYRLEDITPAFAAREIIDTMKEALIVLDRNGAIRVVNSAFCSLFGCRESDIIGKRPLEAMAGCPEFARNLELMREGAMGSSEVVCGPAGGSSHMLSLSSSIMRNAGGEQVATVCLVSDVTDRKHSEDSLRTSEERLSRAQRMAHVGNWERDIKTGQIWWSNETYRIYGVDPEHFEPASADKEVHPDDVSRLRVAVRAAIEARKPFELDYRIIRPDGRVRTVHAIGEAVYDESGAAVSISGTVQDVTEQRLAEAERELLIARLRDANEKLQSLDRVKTNFITMVSHELRTPLTTIKAFAELILMKEGMQEQQKLKMLRTVNVEADRLARLITDLLDLARIESGAMKWQREEFCLEPIIRDVMTGMTLLFEKKALRVTTSFDPDASCVQGDRDRLVQVVTNLLSNAVKFTARGGTIHVAIRQEREPVPHVLAQIVDSGIGIPQSDLELIFEKFHRSDDKRIAGIEGTGLGLAISREIVEHHGGLIWATSTYGKGSVFSFTLPVTENGMEVQNQKRTMPGVQTAGNWED
jgi:PAS domain S-box-containing protein